MSRRRLRAAAAGALATALITGIAACSSSSSGSSASSGGKPTITIWNDALAVGSCGVPASKSFLTKGVALFEKQNPDFNVKIIPGPFAASTGFDTLLRVVRGRRDHARTSRQLYVGGQVIQNAKYLVAAQPATCRSRTTAPSPGGSSSPPAQPGRSPDGKIYAVPYGAGYYYVVYYNKTLFKKAGITGPLPTTLERPHRARQAAQGQGDHAVRRSARRRATWAPGPRTALISAAVGDAGRADDVHRASASLNSPTLTSPYTAWHELFASG